MCYLMLLFKVHGGKLCDEIRSSRTIHTHGNNIPCDLHLEHINKSTRELASVLVCV